MKVLLLNESDINGGAARAAYRLHQGLQATGLDSTMLVRDRFSGDPTVIPRKTLLTKLGPPSTGQILRLYPQGRDAHFTAQWLPDDLLSAIAQQDADLINLHWVCNGFMQIETAGKLTKPVVWTLHDMWGLTGGCHYAGECDRYTQSCGACPQPRASKNRIYHDGFGKER
jgi:hypothetical protein